MDVLVVSSSLDLNSRSENIGKKCAEVLQSLGAEIELLSLKDHVLPRFDNGELMDIPEYRLLHTKVSSSAALVLSSPVYNWSSCSELKRFIEFVGSTPPDGSLQGAFYDKVITFAHAAGLPHSYMASGPLMMSMLLDFKCIISPYPIHVHNRHWEEGMLIPEAIERIEQAMAVLFELTQLLANRTYQSKWSV